MTSDMFRKIPLFLLLLCIGLFLAAPSARAETVTVKGDRITYSLHEELLIVLGHAELVSQDVTIRADEMRTTYRDGQVIELKATGNVEVTKEGDTFYVEEFTYNVKEKTGLILELRADVQIEKSKTTAFLRGGEARYTSEFIEIKESSLTACELDHPHYLFRAKRLEYYPGDKIVAWHMSFWEFNGTIPLLYWPYYVFSLKEQEKDRDFSPQFGYSALTGFFVKLAYSYHFKGGQHGELYADYFQRTGFAGGFKHYYVDKQSNVGSLYVYLQQQPSATSPYLTVQQEHKAKIQKWALNTTNTWKRAITSDTLTSANSIVYSESGTSLRWDGNFGGIYSVYNGELKRTETFRNTVRGQGKLLGFTVSADWYDENYLQLPEDYYASGSIRASTTQPLYDFSILLNQRGERRSENKLYTLPEVELTVKGSGLKDKTLKEYLSPVRFTTQLGHYTEYREDKDDNVTVTDGLRLVNNLSYSRVVRLTNYLNTTLKLAGTTRLYTTFGEKDPGEPPIQGMEDITPSMTVQLTPVKGLTTTATYSYTLSAGSSPFYFDQFRSRQQQDLRMDLYYSRNNLIVRSGTNYNITGKEFGLWSNSLTYRWGDARNGTASNIDFSIPYNIKEKTFNEITSTIQINSPGFKWSLTARINPNELEFGRMDSQLDWKINDDWHINLVGAMDPSKGAYDVYRRAEIELARVFHCRAVTLSYDFIQKEIWLSYQINAFPDQKVRMGSNEYSPILFDLDLGGLTNGQ